MCQALLAARKGLVLTRLIFQAGALLVQLSGQRWFSFVRSMQHALHAPPHH